MECPKCQYVRTANDTCPGYECPKCGIVYAKFDPAIAEQEAALRARLATRLKRPETIEPEPTSPAKPRESLILKMSCDGCGKSATGILTKLTLTNGKYLCGGCAKSPNGEANYYCTSCNASSAFPKIKGSGWIEFVLYLCYFVPGIIYSIWRRSGNSKQCQVCKQATLISAASGSHVKCPDCRELVLRDARKCKHCGTALVSQ